MRPQILKQHVAGIEVSGLFDLKKIMLSLPLTSAVVISRRFVNIDQAQQYICPRTLWYRKSLVCRTNVNSNCLKL